LLRPDRGDGDAGRWATGQGGGRSGGLEGGSLSAVRVARRRPDERTVTERQLGFNFDACVWVWRSSRSRRDSFFFTRSGY